MHLLRVTPPGRAPGLALALALAAAPACGLDPAAPGNLVRPTVDEDPSLPALEVDGTRLHVEIHGPPGAPVVIFLHGGPGGDLAYFEPMIDPVDGKSLADDHRVVLWDQRGTGLSRRHGKDELSLALYERDLDELVDALSPDAPVVLVGHSWGGAYAADYLRRHPERVRGAVLIDPQALTRALFDGNLQAIDTDPFAEWLNDPLWAREVLSPADHAEADFLFGGVTSTPLPRFHNHVDVANLRPGAAVFKYMNREWRDDYDFTVGLDRFPGDVLVLGGTDDEVLGYAFQARQVGFFAHARLAPIDGAGHNDPFTIRRDVTVRAIRAYLDGLEAGS